MSCSAGLGLQLQNLEFQFLFGPRPSVVLNEVDFNHSAALRNPRMHPDTKFQQK